MSVESEFSYDSYDIDEMSNCITIRSCPKHNSLLVEEQKTFITKRTFVENKVSDIESEDDSDYYEDDDEEEEYYTSD